jgi:hypothetical protein
LAFCYSLFSRFPAGGPLSKKTKTPSIRRSREDISKIAAFADWCIWGVTAGIALVFAGITLKDIPFVPALSSTNPDYLQSILLSLYIACWAAGTTIDTKVQNSVYLIDPSGGRVRYGAVIAVVALSLVSLAVLLTRKNELYFSLALAAFTSVDILTWLYLRLRFLPPIIKATREKYRTGPNYDYLGEILLDIVTAQIIGNWKWWRQLALSTIVLLMILVAVSPHAKDAISSLVDGNVPGILPGTTKPLLSDFFLLVFIAVSEFWHFAFRLKTAVSIGVLNELDTNFSIQPIARPRPPKAP